MAARSYAFILEKLLPPVSTCIPLWHYGLLWRIQCRWQMRMSHSMQVGRENSYPWQEYTWTHLITCTPGVCAHVCARLRSEVRDGYKKKKKKRRVVTRHAGMQAREKKKHREEKNVFCSSNLREERQFYKLSNGTPHWGRARRRTESHAWLCGR